MLEIFGMTKREAALLGHWARCKKHWYAQMDLKSFVQVIYENSPKGEGRGNRQVESKGEEGTLKLRLHFTVSRAGGGKQI